METYKAFVERHDGKTARLLMDDDGSEDMWDTILGNFPGSYDLIGEDMIIPGYIHPDTWNESFGPGEDVELMRWLLEGETYDGDLYDGAHIHADNREGIATVTWTEDRWEYVQYITLNPGNFKEIALGADPVADEWEDGCGKPVCRANAKLNIEHFNRYNGVLADGAHIYADISDGYATVTWTEDGREYVQYITLNPGDFEKIILGADPVAEDWEDGCGKPVCRANAEEVE